MARAQFEEKEYEAPLYNQLSAGHPNVWSPGQVFEHRIGIDHGLWIPNLRFWRHIGFRAVRRGNVLSRYDWNFLPAPLRRDLPNFKMNVFIQAKRPYYLKRVRKELRNIGIEAPYYRIDLDSGQQSVLYHVASRLGSSSYICYASPAFHTLEQLFFHTNGQSLVGASTFPSVRQLKDHSSWYYTGGGSSGLANIEPERIEGKLLIEQITEMLSENMIDSIWSENLAILSDTIVSTVADASPIEDMRVPLYLTQVRLIDGARWEIGAAEQAIRHFLRIDLFTELFGVNWYTLG